MAARRRGPAFLHPFVQTAAPGIHKEVANGGELQTQLLSNGDLKVLGRALVLMKDGVECAALDIRENQPMPLRNVVSVGFALLLFFPFAGWAALGEEKGEHVNHTQWIRINSGW